MRQSPQASSERVAISKRLARRAKLRYVCDSEPGIARRRRGQGFSYEFALSGRSVRNPRDIARIEDLTIPPAWADVWICRDPKGHLQSTGRDERRRKQYLYHERWSATVNEAKFDRLLEVGLALPGIRRQVERDLTGPSLSRQAVTALVVKLLDLTGIRVGNSEYLRDNDSYGLTTLINRQVRINGGNVSFAFLGKSGKQQRVELFHPDLARLIERCRSTPGKFVFQFECEGVFRPVTSEDVNTYLYQLTDGLVTTKDFRTWKASVCAAAALAEDVAETSASRKRALNNAVKNAACVLGNTATVCRKYYIHSGIMNGFTEGRLQTPAKEFTPRRRKWHPPEEQLLLHLLRKL